MGVWCDWVVSHFGSDAKGVLVKGTRTVCYWAYALHRS